MIDITPIFSNLYAVEGMKYHLGCHANVVQIICQHVLSFQLFLILETGEKKHIQNFKNSSEEEYERRDRI